MTSPEQPPKKGGPLTMLIALVLYLAVIAVGVLGMILLVGRTS